MLLSRFQTLNFLILLLKTIQRIQKLYIFASQTHPEDAPQEG